MSVVRPVTFIPAARYELIDAQDWYENEVPGLGRRFFGEVEAVIERIRANPQQFPAVHKKVRRDLLRHFPYFLMFLIEPDDSVTVIACFTGAAIPFAGMAGYNPRHHRPDIDKALPVEAFFLRGTPSTPTLLSRFLRALCA